MLASSSESSTSSTESQTKEATQVLNISNVNAKKEVVLNDEQLLGLIQLYPFLYNPNVKPYKDPDYDSYAWDQITKGFNKTYQSLERSVWYTTAELQARWNVLQPIVRSLSKISNIRSLPDSLRQTVIKMSVPMDEKSAADTSKKPLTQAQKTILENIEMFKNLPIQHRRRLEAEMMELILKTELDSKAEKRLFLSDDKRIEKEYKYFFEIAGWEETPWEDIESSQQPQLNNKNDNTTCNTNDIEVAAQNSQIVIKYEITEIADTELLEPLPSKKWVPLSRWPDYVRRCRVRVKRCNVEAMIKEDEIPLARIKRERLAL